MTTEKLYKVPEVAEILNVSKESVYKWCQDGTLKCVRIGTAVRVKESELKRVMEDESN